MIRVTILTRRDSWAEADRVIYFARYRHTLEEIAALEDVSYRTLHRNFGSQCEKGRKLCEAQIRRKQVEKALAGNGDTAMLIWLGKQLLGQRDKHEIDTNWPERLGYGGLPIPRRENDVPGAGKPN